MLLLSAVTGALYLREHARTLEHATQDVRGVADRAVVGISKDIDEYDLVLQTVAGYVRDQAAHGGIDGARLNAFLAEQQQLAPSLEYIRVTDRGGVIRYSSLELPRDPVSQADRDFFRRPREDAGAGIVASGPLFGRISGKWVVVFARRVTGPDGAFMGIVFGSVPAEGFGDSLRRHVPGTGGVAALRTRVRT